MAKPKLTAEQFKEFEELVKQGVTPEDLTKRFPIEIASVHNYKKKLRDMGVKFPDVRGKRPMHYPPANVPLMLPELAIDLEKKYLHLKINNVDIYISPDVKSVHVHNTHIDIKV